MREGRWGWGRPGVIHQSMGVGARLTRAGIRGVLESTLAGVSTFLILRLLICKMGELSLSCVMVPTSEEGFSEMFKVPSPGGPAVRTWRFQG